MFPLNTSSGVALGPAGGLLVEKNENGAATADDSNAEALSTSERGFCMGIADMIYDLCLQAPEAFPAGGYAGSHVNETEISRVLESYENRGSGWE